MVWTPLMSCPEWARSESVMCCLLGSYVVHLPLRTSHVKVNKTRLTVEQRNQRANRRACECVNESQGGSVLVNLVKGTSIISFIIGAHTQKQATVYHNISNRKLITSRPPLQAAPKERIAFNPSSSLFARVMSSCRSALAQRQG